MLGFRRKVLQLLVAAGITIGTLVLGSCGGGGGAVPWTHPGPTKQSPQSVTTSVPFSTVGIATPLPSLAGYSEMITLPPNNAPAGTNLTITLSTMLPAGTPAIPSNFSLTQPFVYMTLTSPNTVTLRGFPGLSLTLPPGVVWNGNLLRLGFYDPVSGWKNIGQPTIKGSTLTFSGSRAPITLLASVKYTALAFACEVTKLFVTNMTDNKVTVYDADGNQINTTGSFPNLSIPVGISFDSHNHHLYVAGNFNTVRVYDEEGNPITTTGNFPNLHGPTGIAFDPVNDLIYVTSNNPATLRVYDEEGNPIATSGSFPNLSGPQFIAFDPTNALLYVTSAAPLNNHMVTAYDQNGNQQTTSGGFPSDIIGAGSEGIAFDSSNDLFYVVEEQSSSNLEVTAYDQNGNLQASSGSFPNLSVSMGIAFDTSNGHLYVANFGNNTVTVYDQNGNRIHTTGTFPNLCSPVDIAIAP